MDLIPIHDFENVCFVFAELVQKKIFTTVIPAVHAL